MFREVMHCIRSVFRIAYLPAIIFACVGATFGLQFAETLGTSELSRRCWQAFAIASALSVAIGPGLILANVRQREYSRAFAAVLLFSPCLLYEGLAAYGFGAQEHDTATHAVTIAKQAKASAQASVTRAEADLLPYLNALDEAAARSQRDAAKALAPPDCRKAWADRARELCDKAAAAEEVLAKAEAKTRLTKALEGAKAKAAAIPEPPPADARAEIVGETFVKWLPVVALTLGSLFGIFAVPPRNGPEKPKARREEPIPSEAKETPKPLPAIASEVICSSPSSEVTRLDIVEALGDLMGGPELPQGLRVEGGWLIGTQRRLAEAVNHPLTSFSRAIKAAEKAQRLEVDTSNNVTRLRLSRAA